jgi:bleomycin hydrolase
MIDNKLLEKYEKRLTNQDKAVMGSIAKNGINDSSLNNEVVRRHNHIFNVRSERGEITSQNSSGRCWMFAALNTARVDTMKKYNVKTFEFSQNYTLFWDKFERSNYFLEAIIETVDENLDSRLLAFLLNDPLGDGGQWDMFKSILTKYGVVPKDHMPETFHSSNTSVLRRYLTGMLRFYTSQLREEYQASNDINKLKSMKEDMLYNIYNILVKSLGNPPKTVNYEYVDKDDKYHNLPEMTPQDFFKEAVGWNLDDKVSLINAPTKDKPYNALYTVKFLGNIAEGDPIKYLNLEISKLKNATLKSLQDGNPVWFGCDVGKLSERNLGIMDMNTFNYNLTLGYVPEWTKEKQLDYYDSALTHAMVFTGVNLDVNGKVVNWEVENSWGEKPGAKGMFSMSDQWFDEFVYQIMTDKKYLESDDLKYLDANVTKLEPWDPMGALAI